MKALELFFLLFVGSALASVSVRDVHWNDSLRPDFRFVAKPMVWNEWVGGAALFEGGRQTARANGTVGAIFDNGLMGKISGEYLAQSLGIKFCSGREHLWVNQGAIGVSVLSDPIEWGLWYSHSNNQSLKTKVVPRKNILCERAIAGSNGFHFSCRSSYAFWESGVVSGSLAYDVVKFTNNKIIQGPGIGLELDQELSFWSSLHLGVDLQTPYIAYNGSVSLRVMVFNCPIDLGIYGQRVHGFRSIPSSSRIGIEVGIDLCEPSHFFAEWLKRPAVYMPEVLVRHDQKQREFGQAPEISALIGDLTLQKGDLNFDLNPYFNGTGPLIFQATGLPPGLTLNPGTGRISGVIDQATAGTSAVKVKATNYFGSASQEINFNF